MNCCTRRALKKVRSYFWPLWIFVLLFSCRLKPFKHKPFTHIANSITEEFWIHFILFAWAHKDKVLYNKCKRKFNKCIYIKLNKMYINICLLKGHVDFFQDCWRDISWWDNAEKSKVPIESLGHRRPQEGRSGKDTNVYQ